MSPSFFMNICPRNGCRVCSVDQKHGLKRLFVLSCNKGRYLDTSVHSGVKSTPKLAQKTQPYIAANDEKRYRSLGMIVSLLKKPMLMKNVESSQKLVKLLIIWTSQQMC